MAFNWTCPHCNSRQTVTERRHKRTAFFLGLQGQAEGGLYTECDAIGCVNPECLKTTIKFCVGREDADSTAVRVDKKTALFDAQIVPIGAARPQPDCVPKALREDYREACLIRDLSPKASATLIRRCLQGMIRDFAGISRGTLNAEVIALRQEVDNGTADRAITPETVDAIDHVRGVGNIGAHMEKDINLIVEVDPGEAQSLIELVELLFEEWYLAREVRRAKLARIAGIADKKKSARNALSDAGSQIGSESNPPK